MVRGSDLGGGEIFRTCPDRPWGPPSLLYKGYRLFPGGKERPLRDADPSPLLVPWSRKSRAIALLPVWAVWPVQSLSVCARVHFTLLTFLLIKLSLTLTYTSAGYGRIEIHFTVCLKSYPLCHFQLEAAVDTI